MFVFKQKTAYEMRIRDWSSDVCASDLPARVGTASSRPATAGSVAVRSGDNLFRIARRNAVADASIYQMLVALWRANPQAFIQNNMNLELGRESCMERVCQLV